MDEPLTRRNLLTGVGTFGVATLAGAAGARAVFSDTASQQQAVRAGDLQLSVGEAATVTITDWNLAPTESRRGVVDLRNDGSIEGSLVVAVSYTEADASHPGGGEVDVSADTLARRLTVSSLTYGGRSVAGTVDASSDGGSDLTLYDLAADTDTSESSLSELADPGAGTRFEIELTYQDVGNAFENDGVRVTFAFLLTQNPD